LIAARGDCNGNCNGNGARGMGQQQRGNICFIAAKNVDNSGWSNRANCVDGRYSRRFVLE
jgi:hypothetical protein